MNNEDVLIQVIKNLIEENKELKSNLKMYKHNYGVEIREHDDLKREIETLKEQLDIDTYNYSQLRNAYNNLLKEDK